MFRRKSPTKDIRPYLLTGFTYCGECGARMCGKSAYGRNTKYPYYEHTMNIKSLTIVPKAHTCKVPKRVKGDVTEDAVWRDIQRLLFDPGFAKGLLEEGAKGSAVSSSEQSREGLKRKIVALESKMESLASRLADLPKEIPATIIYNQMKQLEADKENTQNQITALQNAKLNERKLTDPKNYSSFLEKLKSALGDNPDHEIKQQVISALIAKIEIVPEGLKLHYVVDREKVDDFESMRPGSHKLTNGRGERI